MTTLREITSKLVWGVEEKGPDGFRYALVTCSYPQGGGEWNHSTVFPLLELEQARSPDIYVGHALRSAQTFMVNAVAGLLKSPN